MASNSIRNGVRVRTARKNDTKSARVEDSPWSTAVNLILSLEPVTWCRRSHLGSGFPTLLESGWSKNGDEFEPFVQQSLKCSRKYSGRSMVTETRLMMVSNLNQCNRPGTIPCDTADITVAILRITMQPQGIVTGINAMRNEITLEWEVSDDNI
jgi:hypothetical protein